MYIILFLMSLVIYNCYSVKKDLKYMESLFIPTKKGEGEKKC